MNTLWRCFGNRCQREFTIFASWETKEQTMIIVHPKTNFQIQWKGTFFHFALALSLSHDYLPPSPLLPSSAPSVVLRSRECGLADTGRPPRCSLSAPKTTNGFTQWTIPTLPERKDLRIRITEVSIFYRKLTDGDSAIVKRACYAIFLKLVKRERISNTETRQ